MPDLEHEEWLRDEATRKGSRPSPHFSQKNTSAEQSGTAKTPKTEPEEDEDEDTDDDDADDAQEKEEEQQAGNAV